MSHSAFFYGTLLHPSILRRVIGHDGNLLEICPALLLEHTRHQIRHADYPAVLPYNKSRELFVSAGHEELTPEERTVRGTFVKGLSDQDIALLDLFEGDEYSRENVHVHPLGPLTPLATTPVPTTSLPMQLKSIVATQAIDDYVVPQTASPLPPLTALPLPLPSQTYIYVGPLADLSPELWSYEAFVRENAWKWVGRGVHADNYAEVDRRREMDGKTLKTEIVQATGVDMPGIDGTGARDGGRGDGSWRSPWK